MTTTVILSDRALLGLRILPHAMWDVIASASMLAHQRAAPQFPYRDWAQAAAASAAAGHGAELVRLVSGWPRDQLPTFLLPAPHRGGSDLRRACEDLRAMPPDEVRGRLRADYPDEVPPGYARFETDTEAALKELAEMVDDFVSAIMAAQWPMIAEALDEEIAFRAAALTGGGIDELLGGLHPRVRWKAPEMSLALGPDSGWRSPPERLVLVPMVFARDRLHPITLADGTLAIGYQTRGAARLTLHFTGLSEEPVDRLGILLGRTRAAVLAALGTPRTTTTLAGSLGLALSTVSEHLTLLVSCRLVCRNRKGNRVYYTRSELGERLVREFG
jgi:DNA-binding transcriptional ArsR family regulator